MKRFLFPLQSLTTVRTWREREAREAFAGAVQRLGRAEEQLREAQERRAEFETLLRRRQTATFRPAEHAGFLAALAHQSAQVERAVEARRAAQAAVDQARLAWHGTRTDLRVVEQLEKRARQHHRLAEERAEQGVLDEIASMRGNRFSPVLT